MNFTSELVITGVKPFNQTIDGVTHNFTKVSVLTKFSDGIGFGFSVIDYKWGDSENCKKLQDYEFPIKASVDMEIVTTGTRQSTIVHDIKPIGSLSIAPKPAPSK